MDWSSELPEKDGKYVVKTASTLLGTEYVMYATYTSDKKSWSFNNQMFVAYLK